MCHCQRLHAPPPAAHSHLVASHAACNRLHATRCVQQQQTTRRTLRATTNRARRGSGRRSCSAPPCPPRSRPLRSPRWWTPSRCVHVRVCVCVCVGVGVGVWMWVWVFMRACVHVHGQGRAVFQGAPPLQCAMGLEGLCGWQQACCAAFSCDLGLVVMGAAGEHSRGMQWRPALAWCRRRALPVLSKPHAPPLAVFYYLVFAQVNHCSALFTPTTSLLGSQSLPIIILSPMSNLCR